jgi:flavin-dependent dehydrogenase
LANWAGEAPGKLLGCPPAGGGGRSGMKTDVVIIGGGPAGSVAAMALLREGIRPVVVEKESFPRYHVGESMTGECGRIVRELGLERRMLEAGHPQKKGVSVYGPTARTPWFVSVMAREDETLVEQFTWQVRRSGFDEMLLEEAIARGAEVVRGQAVSVLRDEHGRVTGARVRLPGGTAVDVRSDVLLDCSGQATFLARQGVTGPKYLSTYDKQIAIFSQVAGAVRDGGGSRSADPDNTLIFYRRRYQWAWFIPLDREVVSVGVVVPAAYFRERRQSMRDFLVRELRELNPELSRRLPAVELVDEVHAIPNYSYQVAGFCGPGFVCVGDAHRFVDPIFSFGLFVSMQEALFAAGEVAAYLGGARGAGEPFAAHQLRCERGLDVLEDAIDLFWDHPLAFAVFAHRRYADHVTDIFAGRIYAGQPSQVTEVARRMLGRDRERWYEDGGGYSIPVGSRFRPESAPLWAPDPALETTERWMRG